jgi:UDP-2-acetamido-3-amino-2,3-dideoxy-glucuronate N-acetyltransferase
MTPHNFYAHETAVIDPGVTVGENTKVWHFTHLSAGATIGKDCSLGQNVLVGPRVSIGNGCKIQNNVAVYEGVTLEDDVFCGPSCVFTNVYTPRAFVSRKSEFGKTLVRKGASIGANATIVCGEPNKTTVLGEYCFIAAGAVVTKDVLPHALMAGVPAKRIGWVSRQGEVLRADLTCPRTGEQYEVVDGGLQLVSGSAVPAPSKQ